MRLRLTVVGRLSIANRLKAGLGLIIAFMVLLTVTGIWSLGAINSKVGQIIDVNNAKITLAHDMQNATNIIDKSIMTSIVGRDEATTTVELKKMQSARQAFEGAIEKLEKIETTAKGKEIVATNKNNFAIAWQANERILQLLSSGDMNQAGLMAMGVVQISATLTKSCDELVQYQQELTKKAAAEGRLTYGKATLILIGAGALVLIFAVFLAIFLKNSITRPLMKAVAVAHRIAGGDLAMDVDDTACDETGELLKAIKNMATNLRNIIGEVKTAAENMAAASQQLNNSSEDMSRGAGEQAEKASQVATASEEMSQSVLDVAKHASSIEASATGTASLAKEGEGVVDRSVEKVKAIARTIDESGRLIKLLGERSDQIGAILNVINEIADQTNLLALNAAIEAARAGDAGRGFAVVADEVRKLAERTGSSTSEIGSMIRSIQEEVSRAVASMDAIITEVRSGVDLSTQGGDVLRQIVGSVEQLHLMVQQIASATEEMAATSDQINNDIETIASVSRETSGNSDQVNHAARKLSELSVNLENVVSGFTV